MFWKIALKRYGGGESRNVRDPNVILVVVIDATNASPFRPSIVYSCDALPAQELPSDTPLERLGPATHGEYMVQTLSAIFYQHHTLPPPSKRKGWGTGNAQERRLR